MTGEDQGRALLAEALGLDVTEIGADAAPDTLPAWDSIAHMRLVLAIEERTGETLSADQIFNLVSLLAVAQHLDAAQR